MDKDRQYEVSIEVSRVLREAGFEFTTSNTYAEILEEQGMQPNELDTEYLDVVFDEYRDGSNREEIPWLSLDNGEGLYNSAFYNIRRLFLSRDGRVLAWINSKQNFIFCNLDEYKEVALLIGIIPGHYQIK